MSADSVEPDKNRIDKDPKTGLFLPGNRANPHGRPTGGPNVGTVLRAMLDESHKGFPSKRHAIADALFKLGLKGDIRALRLIFAYDAVPLSLDEATDTEEYAREVCDMIESMKANVRNGRKNGRDLKVEIE